MKPHKEQSNQTATLFAGFIGCCSSSAFFAGVEGIVASFVVFHLVYA